MVYGGSIETSFQFQMRLENIQLLAALFANSSNGAQVNYEKLLSFVSAAMKERYVCTYAQR